MIFCKELNKSFETKAELFKALRESKDIIIADKKAKIYNCEPFDNKGSISAKVIDSAKLQTECKALKIDDDYHYIAVNTTKILDSHEDLHINKIWKKSVVDQQGKVYLVWDHELKGTSTIVKKEHIEMFVAEIPFALLNLPYAGFTEALIYKFKKDRVIDIKAKEWLESGDEIQASVRMRYVKILFALNSDASEDKEYKKNYIKYIDSIANKAEFENDILYFWPVLEAANVLESSLVLFGSNSATGPITDDSKTQEPPKSTPKIEPLKSTLTEKQISELVERIFKHVKN